MDWLHLGVESSHDGLLDILCGLNCPHLICSASNKQVVSIVFINPLRCLVSSIGPLLRQWCVPLSVKLCACKGTLASHYQCNLRNVPFAKLSLALLLLISRWPDIVLVAVPTFQAASTRGCRHLTLVAGGSVGTLYR